jgi:hypothetical protein
LPFAKEGREQQAFSTGFQKREREVVVWYGEG